MYKKDVKKFWNNLSNVSDFGNKEPAKFLFNYFSGLSEKKNIKVLDIGCGGGRNTVMLIKLGFDVFSCDLHEEMVNFTKKRVEKLSIKKKAEVIISSMLHLSYPDKEFDYVVSNGVFHNASSLQELNTTVKEASRVLKNNGELLLNMFSAQVIDSNLCCFDKFVYITPQKLPMILATKEYIEDILIKNNLYLIGEIKETEVLISTGRRSVLRGVFKKIDD